jgi:hypothetical protein
MYVYRGDRVKDDRDTVLLQKERNAQSRPLGKGQKPISGFDFCDGRNDGVRAVYVKPPNMRLHEDNQPSLGDGVENVSQEIRQLNHDLNLLEHALQNTSRQGRRTKTHTHTHTKPAAKDFTSDYENEVLGCAHRYAYSGLGEWLRPPREERQAGMHVPSAAVVYMDDALDNNG